VRLDVTVPRPNGGEQNVRIEASDSTPVDAVVRAVLTSSGWSGEQQLRTGSGRPARSDLTLGTSGLGHGQRLYVGASGLVTPPVTTGLRLAVINGPDAGSVVALDRELTVGRDPSCDLVLTDGDVSRRHVRFSPSPSAVTVCDLDSRNGTAVNWLPIGSAPYALGEGDVVRIGDSSLRVTAATTRPASLRPYEGGSVLVLPAPREVDPTAAAEAVALPSLAQRDRSLRQQLIAAAVPLLAGVVLALALHSKLYLLFALVSPLTVLVTRASEHTGGQSRRRRREFVRMAQEAHREIAARMRDETCARRWELPDPANVAETAALSGARLWERRRMDDDLLSLRIGCRSAPSRLQVQRDSELSSAGELNAVPIACCLREGVVGIVAPPRIVDSLGRWCIAQLAVNCSPADVRIVPLLTDAERWRWLQWLPHVQDGLAVDHHDRSSLVSEVIRIVEERRGQLTHAAATWRGSWIVLFIDSTDQLALAELDEILTDGAHIGVTALCIGRDTSSLPAACRTIVRATSESGTRVAVAQVDDVVVDLVSVEWVDHVARSLARLRAHESGDELPSSCDALALHDAVGLSIEDVLLRWKNSNHSPAALLGACADGPLEVDLVRDGPHALIAGTTGAGKSELLRAWIASLALLHPPEDVAFVLVDYKGGAAFAECAALPHTTGVVTDLDHHEVQRVLTSLGSELQRREMLFAQATVADWAAYRAREPEEPLPRLIVVVDEFAGLAAELPEFVTGLVSLAQRGRSLGIHLILATQRPGGVISPEIRANTSLRIALRTTSPGESADVIESAVASAISPRTPGRAFLLADGERTAFQSAWAGAPAATSEEIVRITPLDAWFAPRADLPPTTTRVASEATQLAALVEILCAAAAQSERQAVRRPWLPPLPSQLPLSEVTTTQGAHAVAIGLADLPREQRQTVVSLNLDGSSTAFVGSSRSGRSSALRTLAVAAANRMGPEDLHIHVIDSGGLIELAELPHVGTILTDREPAVVERFLSRLVEQLAKPQQAPATTMLLVDDWSRLAATDERGQLRLVERMLDLARAARSSGLTLAIAGDRDLLTPRIAAAFGDRFVLPLNQREDYALAGIAPRDVPVTPLPGRAVDKDGHTVQFAHLGDSPDRAGCASVIAAIASLYPAVPQDDRIVVRCLPQLVRDTDLPHRSGIVIGVGGDRAEPVEIDIFSGARRLLVAGPARSGRTTLLRSIGLQAPKDARVLVLVRPRSALATFAERHGWETLSPDSTLLAHNGGERLLVLVDDAERLADSPAADHLASWLREDPDGVAAVVAGRTEDLTITYRGLAAEIRRSRVAVLLQPSILDGELVGASLPRTQPEPIAGRGVLLADPAWRDPAPIPIQIAMA
jgi:S-DNA-T family DNA segregation ATPase FtsK/SpoIIIE